MTAPASGLLSAEEIARVRRPYRAATLLPGRAYHDERIFEFERREFFRRDWLMVARQEDLSQPGSFVFSEVDEEPIVIVRDRDGAIRAFHDLERQLARARAGQGGDGAGAETAGLRPIRLDTWQGFLFISLADDGPSLLDQLGDLVDHFTRFDLAGLRVAHSVSYEADANWKLVAENYSECYHCPGLHPQLNRLTPYDLGADFESSGEWQGGWMELAADAETMALAGGHRNGRPAMAGSTLDDERRITYYLVWPNLFLSLHPDYLLVHRLTPHGSRRTTIECQWLFEPATIAQAGFDPSDAIAFWDLTNRQDWHVCELQQRGTGSRSWVAGRFSNIEPSVHAFDLMVVDRYAGDGVASGRTVRERYDVPPPKPPAQGVATEAGAERVPSRRGRAREIASRT